MAPKAEDREAPQRRRLLVPFARVVGWMDRYDARHPESAWTFGADVVEVSGPDGSAASMTVPFPPLEQTDRAGWSAHVSRQRRLGVLLVRRGGFVVAEVVGGRVEAVKVGRRHVQGKTKAGGWSQQRFARRRDNQTREAFDAAAGHAARLLGASAGRMHALVVGGDKDGLHAVLEDRRLGALARLPQVWVDVSGDPKRAALDTAVEQAESVAVTITDTQPR
jgi:hypothetical protein